MALQGTLSDFGIADIFQLIGQQQKTGTLVLRRKDVAVFIHFREGSIVSADVENRDQSEKLGNMMVRSQLLTDQHLREALDDQKKTLKKLGHILLEKKFIQKRDLDEFIYLQTKETLFKLFRWNSGTYEFIPKDIESNSEFFQPISAEHILMDGFRIVDEWPSIRKKIGSLDQIFERNIEKPMGFGGSQSEAFDQAFDASFAQSEENASPAPSADFSPEVLKVYDLIDGQKDVNDLIWLSRLGEFETCHALGLLIDEQYVVASLRRKSAAFNVEKINIELFQDVEAPKSNFFKRFGDGVYVLAWIFFGLVVMGYFHMGPFANWFQMPFHSVRDLSFREIVSDFQMERLTLNLEAHAFDQGVYPSDLGSLVKEGALSPHDLTYPWKSQYLYQPLDLGYELSKPFF